MVHFEKFCYQSLFSSEAVREITADERSECRHLTSERSRLVKCLHFVRQRISPREHLWKRETNNCVDRLQK